MSRILFLALLISTIVNSQEIQIIPQPVELNKGTGVFKLPQNCKINAAAALDFHREYLSGYLETYAGLNTMADKAGTGSHIYLKLADLPESKKMPGRYHLDVKPNAVYISGDDEQGLLYGIQTLIQLLPVPATGNQYPVSIPRVSITDYPRFGYRGMHLDCSRHFWSLAFIKKYIDYLVLHKFNTFHWHLTDDQGWRIEIRKYPELTTTGAHRNGTIIGRYPGKGNDNIPYSGYYTREEVKEVVQYAAQRFIDVIPEIEMPGHSSAAIAAYPWLSCFPEKPTHIPANMISKKSIEEQKNGRIKLVQETWGVFDDVFCAGKDSTFLFLQNVIDEVIPLFPSKYFHIGGDECPKTHWKKCPHCQQRIKELGLKDEHELQSYFVQRIEKYLNKKGKILIGWDEILEGGLAPNAVVMSWRGEKGGIEAAQQNHDVIMTPGNPVYFDHTQSENEDSVTIGGFNPIEKVYAYEPIPSVLTPEQGKHVLGAQANLWAEYIGNTKKAEYMLFPRMAALGEVLWSPKEKKNWSDFEKRLLTQFKRYDLWGVNYSKAYYELKSTVLPAENHSGVLWKVESKINTPVSINFNGGDSTWYYSTPQLITEKIRFAYASIYTGGNNVGISQQFHFSKATGKKITLKEESAKKYPGDGAFTLVNGVQNEKGLGRSKEFLGFEGNDCEALIDLGKEQEISFVKAHIFEQKGSWIYRPSGMQIMTSADGVNFSGIACSNPQITDREAWCEFLQPVKARFIKILISNYGMIPDGQPGAGHKAWLFVDEIEVE